MINKEEAREAVREAHKREYCSRCDGAIGGAVRFAWRDGNKICRCEQTKN